AVRRRTDRRRQNQALGCWMTHHSGAVVVVLLGPRHQARGLLCSEEMAMSGTERQSRAGAQFGPYRLIRLIGRGGMGEVYEAEDIAKDRIVALKLFPPALSHDQEFRRRLLREAQIAGRLHEPHVVPIHGCDEIEGQLYVDMR